MLSTERVYFSCSQQRKKKIIFTLKKENILLQFYFSSIRSLVEERKRGEKIFRIVTKETHQYGCFRACLMLNDWYTSYTKGIGTWATGKQQKSIDCRHIFVYGTNVLKLLPHYTYVEIMNIWCTGRWILIKSLNDMRVKEREKCDNRHLHGVKHPRENWFNLLAEFSFLYRNEESHFVCIYGKFQFPIFHYPHPVSLPSSSPLFRFSCPKYNFLQSHHLIMIYEYMRIWAKTDYLYVHTSSSPKENFIIIIPAAQKLAANEKKSIFTLKHRRRIKETEN